MRKGIMRTKQIKMIVLDEADEMLSMGFQEQIYDCFQEIPEEAQVCLFSATMPKEALELSQKFMRDPVRILTKKEEVTLEGIQQFYIAVEDERYKFETLCDLYENISVNQSIIFLNTRRKVEEVYDQLTANDFAVSAIHGDMPDEERKKVVNMFRSGSSRVLLATDVLARGIDVQGVSLVVCYDLPGDRENYIHRIGRCGRFGRRGVAINFVTQRDAGALRELEEHYRTQVKELPANIDEILRMS